VDTDDDIVSVHEDPRQVADGPYVRGLNRFQASTPRRPNLGRGGVAPLQSFGLQPAKPTLVEPANELFIDDTPDVVGGCDTLEARKDCSRYWIVLVSVGLEVDAYGIRPSQSWGTLPQSR
jgi:hypothetical protein